MSFTIGSLFDGSGGFPLAASMCGGVPKWASEIEPYPIAVTKSRFPNVKHLGSVTDIKGGEVEPVDVITFGSPCQDLSVAGKRAGLKHEANGDDETTRSGLFMEAVRIIKEMREATNGVYPRFAVWENVPGAFSSNKGEDFRIVLEELIKVVEPSAVMPEVPQSGWPYADSYCGDGWSIAYRVLDAQFWGVPQRRRRIYLVADFRGECAGKVSFEREGLRGYFETSGTPWQTAAGDAEAGSGAADCERNAVGFLRQLSGVEAQEELSPTILAAAGMSGNNKPCVAYAIDQQGGKGGANYAENVMPTLCSDSHGTPHAVAYGFDQGATRDVGVLWLEEQSKTLTNGSCPGHHNGVVVATPVAYSFDALSSNSMKSSNPHSGCRQVDVAKCLDSAHNLNSNNVVRVQYIVRRLTPTECARLQGFPDTWGHPIEKTELTDEEYQFWLNVRNTHAAINDKAVKEYTRDQMLKWYNSLHTDSSEYKMWGNGIALPNALYVMQGIADVMTEEKASRKKWLDDLLGGCL